MKAAEEVRRRRPGWMRVVQDALVAGWLLVVTQGSGFILILWWDQKTDLLSNRWVAVGLFPGWAAFAILASVILTRRWDGWMARKTLRANVIATVVAFLLMAVLFVPLPDSWLK